MSDDSRDSVLDIRRSESGGGGRYEATASGDRVVGELLYDLDQDTVIAHHTETDPSMRGRGIAGRLVERLVADARTEGRKIVPRCPYVRRKFDENPDWQDLRL